MGKRDLLIHYLQLKPVIPELPVMKGFFMYDYFNPEQNRTLAAGMSVLGLAHIGDCVFELCVRAYLCRSGLTKVSELHKQTVAMVNAPAQAAAAVKILPVLDEAEAAVFKRGRNHKVNSVPKNAELADYHSATALESLFGWLYLNGKTDRINELFGIIIGD